MKSFAWVTLAGIALVLGLSARAAEPEYKQVPGQEAPSGKKDRKFSLTYTAKVAEVPAGTRKLELWIPVPQKNKHQDIGDVAFSVEPASIEIEPKYGNKIAYWKLEGDAVKPTEVTLTFQCKRKEIAGFGKIAEAKALKDDERKKLHMFLQGNDLVLVGEKIKDVVEKATGEAQSPVEVSKAAYDYVLTNVRYDKPAGKAWGRGSTQWACDEKYGNCTDFHALFMSICMTKGVPTKFEMGIPLPEHKTEGPIGGYHCWAKFYLGDVGWVPVDISEAWKEKEKYGVYYYGNLTPDRVQFTTGRMVDLVPKQAGETLNYFIYPYAEADGKAIKTDKAFSFKDLAAD